MEQPMPNAPQTPPPPPQYQPPVAPPPIQTPPPVQPTPPIQPVQSVQQKSHAWAWVLGSCLSVLILVVIVFIALGWWGARKVKNEIQKYEPSAQQLKDNIEKMNQEGEDWQKKSEEFQKSLPSPEEIQRQMENANNVK